jgi:hypothetical protein
MATAGSSSNLNVGHLIPNPIWVRLRYDASNSFIVSWSPDGLSYIGATTIAFTLTPTHVGVMWSAWNASSTDGRRIATYGPLLAT